MSKFDVLYYTVLHTSRIGGFGHMDSVGECLCLYRGGMDRILTRRPRCHILLSHLQDCGPSGRNIADFAIKIKADVNESPGLDGKGEYGGNIVRGV